MSNTVDFSTLYTYFYTGSNVKVFLSTKDLGRSVHLDMATGVGYDYNISSIPVFTLGLNTPAFFSKGNGVGQGMLALSFIDEMYFKVALKYVFGEEADVKTDSAVGRSSYTLYSTKNMSDGDFRNFSNGQENNLPTEYDNLNIVHIRTLFDIKIVLDNSNPYKNSKPKVIVLEDCKLTGESMDISSMRDSALQVGYKFYFKNIRRESL